MEGSFELFAAEMESEAVGRGEFARCANGHTFYPEEAKTGGREEMITALLCEGIISAPNELDGLDETEILALLLKHAAYALPDGCCPICSGKVERQI